MDRTPKNKTGSKQPVIRDGPGARRRKARNRRGQRGRSVPVAKAGGSDSRDIPAGRRFREPARLVGAQGRIRTRRPVLLLTGLSLALCCTLFPPLDWWPAAYLCLTPWLVAVCTARKSRFVYFASYLLGLGFFLVHIRWLIPVMWEAYLSGYLALCLGFAVFFPLAAWPIRHMYRRHGVSVAVTAPVVWVAIEYLRSLGPLGFPWLLLGHSQYKILSVIQISDLVGAYGVSFVVVMVNGWVTDLLIQPILIWRAERGRRVPVGSLTTLLVVFGTLIYGRAQRSGRHLEPGPRVAVIQHDFPMYVDAKRAMRTPPQAVFEAYLELTRQAAAEKPDLILLPETAMHGYVNEEFLEAGQGDLEEILRHRYPPSWQLANLKYLQSMSAAILEGFQEVSTRTGVPIVLGSSALVLKSTDIPPRAEAFNSAYLLQPGRLKPVARYDKIHLVLFGEYVPFRRSWPWMYEKLNSFTPWGSDGRHYSLTPGRDYTVFEIAAASQPGRRYRAGVAICYEEIMPYVARNSARGGPRGDSRSSDGRGARSSDGRGTRSSGDSRPGGDEKNIDILLSISNDGWFLHSSELEQHLVAGVFRAVENRIAVARSVNTGASAIIHPNGEIHDRATLSQEKIAKLEPLEAALGRLRDIADRLADELGSETGYRSAVQDLSSMIKQDFRDGVAALGREFAFMEPRLRSVTFALAAKDLEKRRTAVEDLRGQIKDDLETVRRWKDEPWNAPGYAISTVKCDGRLTIYTRWGDWFAQGTVALFAVMLLDWLLRRFLRRPSPADGAKDGEPDE